MTYAGEGSFPLVNSSFHCSDVSRNRLTIKKIEICYIVWIVYHVNHKHVELTAVLGFNVILTGSFFLSLLGVMMQKGLCFVFYCVILIVPPCTMCAVV